MNEESKTTPVMDMILDRMNSRLNTYDEFINSIKEVLDRLNTDHPSPGKILDCMKQPTVMDRTIVNRLHDFNESFERANTRLEALYERLREVV